MNTSRDHRLEPVTLSPELVKQLESLVQEGGRPSLLSADGEAVELPEALGEALLYLVEAMARHQPVVMLAEDEALTTRAAASVLGVSRPYLVRLLDAGDIPHHRVGTHRRVRLSDLRAWQARRDQQRRGTLDALAAEVDAAGMYDPA